MDATPHPSSWLSTHAARRCQLDPPSARASIVAPSPSRRLASPRRRAGRLQAGLRLLRDRPDGRGPLALGRRDPRAGLARPRGAGVMGCHRGSSGVIGRAPPPGLARPPRRARARAAAAREPRLHGARALCVVCGFARDDEACQLLCACLRAMKLTIEQRGAAPPPRARRPRRRVTVTRRAAMCAARCWGVGWDEAVA